MFIFNMVRVADRLQRQEPMSTPHALNWCKTGLLCTRLKQQPSVQNKIYLFFIALQTWHDFRIIIIKVTILIAVNFGEM